MKNRMTRHIVETLKSVNQFSNSEVIKRQAEVIERLSNAYESLWKEFQETRQNYKKAWEYMNELHHAARATNKPMYQALKEAIQNYEEDSK